MLHPLDDYPLHQTSQVISLPATESPNYYDRFFFNGWHPEGDVFFAVAFGVYPNRQVMDGAFSVVRDGVQHNVRATRTCPDDRTQTSVDPITITIEEPMRRHLIQVSDRFGLAADLHYTAMSPAIEEPRFLHVVGNRTRMDYTRLTQFGRWSGWIELDGERIEIDQTHVGVRDRSWGIRPVGEQPTAPSAAPQFFWIWCPTVFEDRCTHFALNHEADGRVWHQSGAVVPRLEDGEPVIDPGRVQRGESATIDVEWGQGTRWARSLTTRLGLWNCEPLEVTYEPLVRFQMSGIGYLHPEWGHGKWRGEADATRDKIVLDEIDPLSGKYVHIQALSRARCGTQIGMGVVEQLILGPHEPTGLAGVLEGAGSSSPQN